MPWKSKLLKNADLYLILDTDVCDYNRLFDILEQAISGGVNIVQLRDKRGSSADILNFSRRALDIIKDKALFVVNDRIDLAHESQAAGVHLGQEDMSVPQARRLMGDGAIIGCSCQTLEQALKAENEGADYIGFGSVFKTFTKPKRNPMDLQLLGKVLKRVEIPVFAIGGIDRQNISQLFPLGVQRVAVCRAICEAQNVREETLHFRQSLDHLKLNHQLQRG